MAPKKNNLPPTPVKQKPKTKEAADLTLLKKIVGLPVETPFKRNTGFGCSYMIMLGENNSFPPFLLSCIATLDKNGIHIESFDTLVSGIAPENDYLLNDRRRLMNIYAYEMFFIAEKNPELFNKQTFISLYRLFDYWRDMFPFLHHEFVYLHPFSDLGVVKEKPSIEQLQVVQVKQERPRISFELKHKIEFFELKMKILLEGKIINHYKIIGSFFLQVDQNIYIFSNLRDAALAEWVYNKGGSISIGKEKLPDFTSGILQVLGKCYQVEVVG